MEVISNLDEFIFSRDKTFFERLRENGERNLT